MEEMNLKTWVRCEKIRELYEKHRGLYWLRVVLSLVFMSAFILGLIALLFWLVYYVRRPLKAYDWFFIGLLLLIIGEPLYLAFKDKPWENSFYLKQEQYRALYDDVAEMCRELRIMPVDRIYLGLFDPLCVISRLPFLQFLRKNILIIGYPAFCSVDAKAMRVLITHELGHLADEHSAGDLLRRLFMWFWSNGPFSLLFRLFFPPHPPLLLPLEAEQEKAADEYCRTTFACGDFTAAMTQMVAGESLFDEAALLKKLVSVEKGGDLAGAIRAFRRELPDDDTLRRELEHMLRADNPVNDPHPAFRERVGTADVEALLNCLKHTPDAAEHYLLASPNFERDFNEYLEKTVREGLDMYQKSIDEMREKLDSLDMSSVNPDTFTDALPPARTLGRMDLYNACLDILRERFPDSLSARATVLSAQMDRAVDDQELDEAAGKLEQLVSGTPMLALQFASVLEMYWLRQGDPARVKQILAIEDSAAGRMRKAFKAKLKMDDVLFTGDIPDCYVSDFAEALADPSLRVEKFYLVSRRYDRSIALGTLFLYLVRKPLRSFSVSNTSDDDVVNSLSAAFGANNYPITVRIATKKDIKILEAKGIPAHVPGKARRTPA